MLKQVMRSNYETCLKCIHTPSTRPNGTSRVMSFAQPEVPLSGGYFEARDGALHIEVGFRQQHEKKELTIKEVIMARLVVMLKRAPHRREKKRMSGKTPASR
jgi:hypothetical protein